MAIFQLFKLKNSLLLVYSLTRVSTHVSVEFEMTVGGAGFEFEIFAVVSSGSVAQQSFCSGPLLRPPKTK